MAGGGGGAGGTQTQKKTVSLAEGPNTPSQAPPLPVPGQDQITGAVLGSLEPHTFDAIGGAPNPFVPAGPQQQAAMNQIFGYSQQADPFFGEGLAQQRGTVAGQYFQSPTIQGKYLDPMNAAPFQRMANAREGFARNLFNQFAPEASGRAVAGGTPYRSTSREAEVQRGGERIASQAAQDIAQAGWGQFAREREFQEAANARERALQDAAAKYGTQLAPGLAGTVFSQNEQLRAAEQGANQFQTGEDTKRDIANLTAQMTAEGFDEASIKNAIDFMRNQQAATVTGPTPAQTFLDYLKAAATGAQGVGAADYIRNLINNMGGDSGDVSNAHAPFDPNAPVRAPGWQGTVVPPSPAPTATPDSPLAAPGWMPPERTLWDTQAWE